VISRFLAGPPALLSGRRSWFRRYQLTVVVQVLRAAERVDDINGGLTTLCTVTPPPGADPGWVMSLLPSPDQPTISRPALG
jgi:hypothetical protein